MDLQRATSIVFIANGSYALGLAATLRSVVQHTHPLPAIHVIDVGLSEEDRRRIDEVAAVSWILVSQSQEQDLQQRGLLPPSSATSARASYAASACWFKLGLAQLLPPQAQRALYMDSDLLALTSLQPLLGLDLQGCLLAAARDVGHPCGHDQLGECGWPAGRAYFNAGLLLLDLQKMRQAGAAVAATLAKHVSVPGPWLRFHDQDVLNLLAHRLDGGPASPAWLELPLRWNAQGIGTYARFRLRSEPDKPALFASPEALREFEEHPAVVHFTGPPTVAPSAFLDAWNPYTSKPWAYLCQHPFVPAFFAALDTTPWRGWRPQQDQVGEACAAELQLLLDRIAAVKEGFDAAAAKQQLARLLEG